MRGGIAVIALLTAVCAHADVGPRLTDAEFFTMLDPTYPGLEKVEAAVIDRGDGRRG